MPPLRCPSPRSPGQPRPVGARTVAAGWLWWPARSVRACGRPLTNDRGLIDPAPGAAPVGLRAGPPPVGQSARGVWPRAEARVALKGLPGGRGAGCGSGRGRQLTVFCFGRPTLSLELARNRLPYPKYFLPGFSIRDCSEIQNLLECEILGIWRTYGHPPLKCELNAAKVRVTTRPSYLARNVA